MREKGFTLVEVVIAISIMSLIFMISYRAINQIGISKNEIDNEREAMQIANTILTRFTREFQMAIMDDRSQFPESEIRDYKFIGDDETISGGEDGDSVTFMAKEAGQFIPGGQSHSGVVMITYKVEKNPDYRVGRDDKELFQLIREETPVFVVGNNTTSNRYIVESKRLKEQRMVFPITDKLVSLDFKYFDHGAREWQSDWKEKHRQGQTSIPGMIRMKIKIKTDLGKVMTFATAVPIEAGKQFSR